MLRVSTTNNSYNSFSFHDFTFIANFSYRSSYFHNINLLKINIFLFVSKRTLFLSKDYSSFC